MEVTSYVSIASGAVAASSLAFKPFKRAKVRKRLIQYDIDETSLLPDNTGFAELGVTYKGQKLEAPKLFTITFWNVGLEALESTFIDQPIKVKFPDGEIVAYTVALLVSPTDEPDFYEDKDIARTDHEIGAPKRLVNKGAGIVFKVLTDGCKASPKAYLSATNFELEPKPGEPTAGGPRFRLPTIFLLVFGVLAVVTGLLGALSGN
ncbi:hypothetical protein [Actinoplanes aureus]|uniref:Uncharacterized protein n=1 Tax=Actinoplanes aureus TaxID=2792083 RepID=A0A931C469_9ACTN|nr:hypothetical protein [Actinoplanes aureus]MBG0560123.1 hypothetical protein [Actinoplanes aureus]